ncbi:MAG: type II toxin-antitoxin system VapC family toxin [Thermodesulfobacteriota bacterium]
METTIVSYLAARASRDLIVVGHQQITQEWWDARRLHYNLFISELVIREAGAGDKGVAQRRLDALEEIPLLELNEEALSLAGELAKRGPIPARAKEDALHIALATVHGMDFLLTWNCRHIANAEMRAGIMAAALSQGYEAPVICTPEELIGE